LAETFTTAELIFAIPAHVSSFPASNTLAIID
jgi:hypothetical protein